MFKNRKLNIVIILIKLKMRGLILLAVLIGNLN